MTDIIEYVVTVNYGKAGIATAEMTDETLTQVVNNTATFQYDAVERVLELNITDGTCRDVTEDVINAAFKQAIAEAYTIDDIPTDLTCQLGKMLADHVGENTPMSEWDKQTARWEERQERGAFA